MHPIGLALGFLVFWSLVAVGVFLMLLGARRMRHGLRGGFWAMVNGAVMLLGVTLTGAGVYATFVVLYGR